MAASGNTKVFEVYAMRITVFCFFPSVCVFFGSCTYLLVLSVLACVSLGLLKGVTSGTGLITGTINCEFCDSGRNRNT